MRRLAKSSVLELTVVGCLLLLFLVPLAEPSNFAYQLMWLGLTSVSISVAWLILGGYAGYFNFGAPAFIGVGSYSVAILYGREGWPAWGGLLAGIVLASALGLVVGSITLRLRGIYFSLLTLFIVYVLQALANAVPGFTGGSSGMSLPFLVEDFTNEGRIFHWLATGCALITIACAIAVSRSRYVLALRAIKDDEDVAETMGVSTSLMKVATFMLSCGLMGMVGGLIALQATFVDPQVAFGLETAITSVLAPVLGGINYWVGGVVGALVVETINWGARLHVSPEYNRAVYGLMLILVIRFFPGGVVGFLVHGRERLRGRRPRRPSDQMAGRDDTSGLETSSDTALLESTDSQ